MAEAQKCLEYYDDRDNCDPHKLVQCPFEKSHEITALKFPQHIVKCGKAHPKLAKELKTCPYSARHLVPEVEFKYHLTNCTSRPEQDEEEHDVDSRKWFSERGACPIPESENWEQEADEDAPVFVWGPTAINHKPKGNWKPKTTK